MFQKIQAEKLSYWAEYADDTKLGTGADTPEDHAAIQREFNRLKIMGREHHEVQQRQLQGPALEDK